MYLGLLLQWRVYDQRPPMPATLRRPEQVWHRVVLRESQLGRFRVWQLWRPGRGKVPTLLQTVSTPHSFTDLTSHTLHERHRNLFIIF